MFGAPLDLAGGIDRVMGDRSMFARILSRFRLDYGRAAGAIERSTCCDNTATENLMMAKLMIDSAELWAVQYKIDSFRFDLMGHQPRAESRSDKLPGHHNETQSPHHFSAEDKEQQAADQHFKEKIDIHFL